MQKYTPKAQRSKTSTNVGEIPNMFGASDPYYTRRPKGTIGFILRIISLVLGVALLFLGIATIALGSCHDRGGFCAGSLNAKQYAGGLIACFCAGLFLARAFTESYKKMLATGLSITVVTLLWVALIDTHI